jgi:hypothetical protein
MSRRSPIRRANLIARLDADDRLAPVSARAALFVSLNTLKAHVRSV